MLTSQSESVGEKDDVSTIYIKLVMDVCMSQEIKTFDGL